MDQASKAKQHHSVAAPDRPQNPLPPGPRRGAAAVAPARPAAAPAWRPAGAPAPAPPVAAGATAGTLPASDTALLSITRGPQGFNVWLKGSRGVIRGAEVSSEATRLSQGSAAQKGRGSVDYSCCKEGTQSDLDTREIMQGTCCFAVRTEV